jgi:hypothetical protein
MEVSIVALVPICAIESKRDQLGRLENLMNEPRFLSAFINFLLASSAASKLLRSSSSPMFKSVLLLTVERAIATSSSLEPPSLG